MVIMIQRHFLERTEKLGQETKGKSIQNKKQGKGRGERKKNLNNKIKYYITRQLTRLKLIFSLNINFFLFEKNQFSLI